MNALFVYQSKDGHIFVEELEKARILEDNPIMEHIGTIDPRSFLEHILNEEKEVVKRHFR